MRRTGILLISLSLACLLLALPFSAQADFLREPGCRVHVIHQTIILNQCHRAKPKCHRAKPVRHVRKQKCHPPKKHHRKHCRRAQRCGCYGCPPPPCVQCYIPQNEPVEFRWGVPAPCGHYVNVEECDFYAPDRITGDDDPTIYPGMNIDN